MKDLLERLRAAMEGDAELDLAIAEAVGWPDGHGAAQLYTRSLDAAVTSVAEGEPWSLRCYKDRAAATIGWDGSNVHDAPTPALALCMAALMAREAAGER